MTVQISTLRVMPELDATKYVAGAQQVASADKSMAAEKLAVGQAFTATDGKISASGDVLSRLSRQYVEGYAAQQRFEQGLRQLGRGLETGKISMEGAERIIIGMNQRLGLSADVAQLAAKGQNELAAAVARANAQIARQATELATADGANRKHQAANSNAISAGARNAAGFNAGQQIQDIAMMSMLGQAPMTLALQQGPQLATAIQQGGGLAALGAGLAAVFSTTTLLTVGFTAATAATIQWFMKGREGAKDLDEKLKGHSELLSRLKRQYGELGEAAKNLMPIGGAAYTEAQARSEIDTIRAAIRSQSGDLSKEFIGGGFLRGGLFGSDTGGLDALLSARGSPFQGAIDTLLKSVRDGNGGLEKFDANLNKIFDDLRKGSDDPAKLAEEMQRLSDAAVDAFAVAGKMSPFQSEIDRLLLGLKEGNGDLSTFASHVRRIGELNGIGKQADDVILAAKEAVSLAEKLREVEAILRRIDQENTRPGLRSVRELGRYVAGRDAEARNLEERFAADQQLARARTNAERLAAIEAQVRARAREDGDSGGGLQGRLSRALAEERTRQEVEARDAVIQRSQALERTLQQQRLELDLIGKTAGEQAKLRFEFERMQELREQAARTGDPIDEKEVATIKSAAEAMKQYAEAMGRARLQQDLLFEREQLFRSPQDQEIAGRLHSAGLPVDFDSVEAGLIRANQQLARMKDAWEDIFDTANSGVDTLVDALFDGTTSIEDALKSIGRDFAKQMFDTALTNPLKNWLTGSNFNTIADLGIFGDGASSGRGGGFGGVLGNLLGAQKAVASMQVQAASVVINGSPIGGIPGMPGLPGAPANDNGGLLGWLGNLFGGNGQKSTNFQPNTTLAQFLGYGGSGGGAYGSDMASNIKALAGNIGANPRDLAAVMSFESGFRPNVWGGAGGGHYGLIQAGAAERAAYGITPGGSLADQFAGIERYFKDRGFKPGMSGMDLYSTVNAGSPGRYNASDTMNGGTWGTVADKWNHQMGPHFQKADALLGPTNKASDALEKLATSSVDTAGSLANGLGSLTGVTQSTMQALEQFGIGTNNLGAMLQNLMNTGGGFGGNWFANLASMFGGAGGALNHMNSISPMATAHILKGGVGLFANGAAFSGGNVIPFANGDVFSSPTYFQMGGGKTGLLGEAGPEAIMPLRRGPDGKLGVSAGTEQGQQNRGMSQGQVDAILNALKKLQMNAKIVNVFDPSIVGDYLRTDEGERLIMNVQRRNG